VPFVASGFQTLEVTYALIFAIAILGLNVLTGFSGQISLGHGAFVAIGAFTAAIGVHTGHLPYLATIPLAALICGLLGFGIGVAAGRLEGIYLGLATFALGVATPDVLKKQTDLTGGVKGLSLPPVTSPFGMRVDPVTGRYQLHAGIDIGAAGAIGILVLMFASYVLAVRAADAISPRMVLMAIAALHALILLAPPLLSMDVFSYQAYARMGAVYGLNPYLSGPHVIALDPLYPFIGAKWVGTPSAYGPLFTALSYFLAPLKADRGYEHVRWLKAKRQRERVKDHLVRLGGMDEGDDFLLLRLVERYGAVGDGVDLSPPFVREARQRAHERVTAAADRTAGADA